MTERIETARSLRDSAEKLRQVAKTDPVLSAKLVGIAEEIEEDAALLEGSFRDEPSDPASDQAAASPMGFSGQ